MLLEEVEIEGDSDGLLSRHLGLSARGGFW